MKSLLILAIPAAWAVSLPTPEAHAAAPPAAVGIPARCVEHVDAGSDGGEMPGDYRCAGLYLPFHVAGSARSPEPIWAGQWLFLDPAGGFRMGSCTFNRGVHPSVLAPAERVSQTFPNDPDGSRGAYLTWRYGGTTDDLTAAALWAVFHYYAQDPAGSARAEPSTSPLVSSLDIVGAASGRPDVQARALELDGEAHRRGGPWSLEVAVDVAGTVDVSLTGPQGPLAGELVNVSVGEAAWDVTTGDDGRAHLTVDAAPGRLAVVATVSAPGAAIVVRGPPADPGHAVGAQTLIAGGPPAELRAEAGVDIPPPTTTTTIPPATTTTTTIPPATTSTTSTTSTTVALVSEGPSTPPPAPSPPSVRPPQLPETGAGDELTAYLATAAVVGGIGLVGAVRRRAPAAPPDPFWG